jgi:mRNA-degrading endonuclease YafQ of YafQ-DinJ toxin-antitoxin module
VYTIEASKYFLRRAKKFFKKRPDLKKNFVDVADDLKKDPFQPHLALHSLTGKLQDCYAVSLTYSYRITMTLVPVSLLSPHISVLLFDSPQHSVLVPIPIELLAFFPELSYSRAVPI